MYSDNYLLKTSTGNSIKFFYQENSICKLHLDSVQSLPHKIISHVKESFSLCIDKDDCIHILCKDHQDNILYLNYSNNVWKKKTVIHYESNRYTKDLNIISVNDCVFLFYISVVGSDSLLMVQYHKNNCLSKPFIVDYVSKNDILIYVESDCTGNLYAFYSKEDGLKIGYRILNKRFGRKSNYYQIQDIDYKPKFIRIFMDSKLNIHVVWLSSNYSILYANCNLYKNSSRLFKSVISPSVSEVKDLALFMYDSLLWCGWIHDKDAFLCSFNNTSLSWNQPTKSSNIQNVCGFNCISNYSSDETGFLTGYALGDTSTMKPCLVDTVCDTNADTTAAAEVKSNILPEGAYWESLNSYFYKIIDKLNALEAEKKSFGEKYLYLETKYTKVNDEARQLRLELKEAILRQEKLTQISNKSLEQLKKQEAQNKDFIKKINELEKYIEVMDRENRKNRFFNFIQRIFT